MASPAWRFGLWVFLAASAALLVSSVQLLGIDFGPMWAAARLAMHSPFAAYDAMQVTRAQPWILGSVEHPTLRPFAYPPTALALSSLFAWLPFGVAATLWVTLGLGVCAWALYRAGAPWWTLAFTPFLQAVIAGQATLLCMGLVLFGLLSKRAIVAGVLFAVAGCLKPQLLCLLPIALVAQRRLDTALATGVAAALMIGATLGVWGVELWVHWFEAMGQFGALLLTKDYLPGVITPYAALVGLGLDGRWAWLLLPLAVWGVWTTFRDDRDPLLKLLALGGGALMLSPYAMAYDLALLAPAMAVGVDRRAPAATAAAYLYAMGFWVCGALAIFAPLVLLFRPRGALRAAEAAIVARR